MSGPRPRARGVGRAAVLLLAAALALGSGSAAHAGRAAGKPARGARAAKAAPTRAVRGQRAVEPQRAAFRTAIVKPSEVELALFTGLDKIRATRPLKRGTTAIYVVDARTGEEIYAVHEDEPMNPASNVKLISTAAVLSYLGPEWRFETRLFGPTPDRAGVARGDVYLRGSWDPTLSIAHLDDLAGQLATRGVTRIEGDVLVGPLSRRDSVASARYHVTVTPGKPGEPPQVTVDTPPGLVEVVVEAVTARGRKSPSVVAESFVDPAGEERIRITVKGKIGAGRVRSFTRSPANLPLYTGHALRTALEARGIAVAGRVRIMEFADHVQATAGRYLPVELANHRSVSLSTMVAWVNKRSINYLADRLTRLAGAVAFGGEPSMDKGVRLMKRWLSEVTGIGPDQVVLDTGSGLSYHTQLSARQVVQVLREAAGYCQHDEAASHRNPELEALFRRSLAVAGIDGTLRRRYTGSIVRGKVLGKTGTLTGIVSLAGIVTAGDRELAFSIITNGHVPTQRTAVRDEHRLMVESIYRYLQPQ